MDNSKLDRKRRAAVAGGLKVRKQVRETVDTQSQFQQELSSEKSKSRELVCRKIGIEHRYDQRSSNDLLRRNSSTNRALNESVLQLALLEVLSNLSRISESKEESLKAKLQQQSAELSRLNAVSDSYALAEQRVDLTKRFALELAE